MAFQSMPTEHWAVEVDMLGRGFTYAEVAAAIGCRKGTLIERNLRIHRIDVRAAFRERLAREGVPNRMPPNDRFRSWFSGIVDGEGHFVVFSRRRVKDPRWVECRVGLQITLRDDDKAVLTRIQRETGVGRVYAAPGRGTGNPSATWACYTTKDLAEVFVPLFEESPLYSKKGREFEVWRPLVMMKYEETMGGRVKSRGLEANQAAAFERARQEIDGIRTYKRR